VATVPSQLDYLAHLSRESARFAAAIADAPPAAPVPSCPDWTADDLLWHLAEVQWFWGTIVREGVDGEAAEAMKPPRPGERAALAQFFDHASRDLAAALAAAPPDTAAWTWSDDHTVGFIRRRQAHEALIHRLDAELTADCRTVMDQALSADGVDEALRVMFDGAPPEWGAITLEPGRTVRITATDAGTSWHVNLGRFTGTSPRGQSYDEPALAVADVDPGTPVGAAVAGSAADLDAWLWGRPPLGSMERSGDPATLSGFDAVIATGID